MLEQQTTDKPVNKFKIKGTAVPWIFFLPFLKTGVVLALFHSSEPLLITVTLTSRMAPKLPQPATCALMGASYQAQWTYVHPEGAPSLPFH